MKVRLQTQPHDGSRKNMMQMVSHVVKSDGFTGLYRGVRGDLFKNTKIQSLTVSHSYLPPSYARSHTAPLASVSMKS